MNEEIERSGTSAQGAAGAATGWYPAETGYVRWWDGYQWGPPVLTHGQVAMTAPADNTKTLVVLAHLGCVLGGFILPLVILLVEKRNPFVRHHAAEALNFQLTMMIVILVSIPLALVLVGFFTLIAAIVANYVFGIMGAVKAGRGEWFRYPVNLRMVKP